MSGTSTTSGESHGAADAQACATTNGETAVTGPKAYATTTGKAHGAADLQASATTNGETAVTDFPVCATTNDHPATTSNGAVAPQAKTAVPIQSWRIEINRRKRKQDGFLYHWNYRFTLANGRRKTQYGGTLATLIQLNEERWYDYQKRSKKHKRRSRKKQPTRA